MVLLSILVLCVHFHSLSGFKLTPDYRFKSRKDKVSQSDRENAMTFSLSQEALLTTKNEFCVCGENDDEDHDHF